MGQFSGAYAARVSRDLTLCSRYDFNMYSYESEWTMGAEWWIRRTKARQLPLVKAVGDAPVMSLPNPAVEIEEDEIQGVVKARVGSDAVRCQPTLLPFLLTKFADRVFDVGRPAKEYPH